MVLRVIFQRVTTLTNVTAKTQERERLTVYENKLNVAQFQSLELMRNEASCYILYSRVSSFSQYAIADPVVSMSYNTVWWLYNYLDIMQKHRRIYSFHAMKNSLCDFDEHADQ